ncbi:MAG TPA: sigma-70 family RNA polymerase sigma factor [Candidatus Elarobacter sp.]|nr:sigma-70 family RNA polymerase sigma factor [Candidatus Elarobacter sp.]HEV2739095.1 sigma-70 family RNA polymerase sigma factor [Candidatus Elarobacter sp.]
MTRPGVEARPRSRFPAPFEADALVRRVADRDVEAFEVLYEAYHRLVFGIGLRLLGDDASAEDLTQGVFLKVWVNPAAFKGGSLVSWVTRVARNAGLDVIRQRSTRAETEMPADLPLDGALEDAVFTNLDARRVRSALMRLPATERVPIEMGFFGGMTYHRVATETGVPLGTVKTRIRTGLHRLRHALEARSGEAC